MKNLCVRTVCVCIVYTGCSHSRTLCPGVRKKIKTVGTHKKSLTAGVDSSNFWNELNYKLQIFEKKRESYQKKSLKFRQAVDHIKGQAELTEKQIKEEFQRLHELLHKEECVRLQTVTNEKERKIAALNQLIDDTNKDVIALDQLIDSVKKDIQDTDLNILRNFQSFKRKAQWTSREPRLSHDSLLNVGKHVGALGFNIWRNMQSHVKYYPVVLNPNSASPWLSLSDDLTSMKESSERTTAPENPERFDPCVLVLGSEGYASGRHKWEVMVSDSPKWVLGVCKESVIRKKKFTLSPNRGVWAISLSKGVYQALLAERQQLEVPQRPERIRIKLDWDKGEVSFYDGDTSTHLVTLTHRFDERMFPIFGPALHSKPMSLAPGKTTLHT
ncbi:tripartite motif containing 35-28 isoform X2 [Gouania willdenowi]|uniref:tripartite motif containing 35-28 isoform X2 n=1 Tax=Gouania willdenowi TaxID=441366 RepID=UPI001056426E|nr:nuclear factor 7, brain-like isoform X2 [Gouania willdenowi]